MANLKDILEKIVNEATAFNSMEKVLVLHPSAFDLMKEHIKRVPHGIMTFQDWYYIEHNGIRTEVVLSFKLPKYNAMYIHRWLYDTVYKP
jgi:hypothetical protein